MTDALSFRSHRPNLPATQSEALSRLQETVAEQSAVIQALDEERLAASRSAGTSS